MIFLKSNFSYIETCGNNNNITSKIVKTIKNDLSPDEVYVFTPKGDIIELPKGATPIDFAYKIHTKVGETMVGAIVNDQIVPLDYELQDNDIVKINTNKSATPSREWLNIAKATTTKNKIKSYFTKNEKDIYIEKGKYLLEKSLKKRKITLGDFYKEENLKNIYKEFKDIDNLDDLYLNIGNEKITRTSVINVNFKEPEEEKKTKLAKVNKNSLDADIIVSGIDKVKVNLAHCCSPVYGDEIIGYITKGNGITVHRINCPNLDSMEERTVEVNWNSNANKKYMSYLFVYSNNRENHLLDFLQVLSAGGINVEEARILNKDASFIYEIIIYVTGLDQLEKIILSLNNNSYVDYVERAFK